MCLCNRGQMDNVWSISWCVRCIKKILHLSIWLKVPVRISAQHECLISCLLVAPHRCRPVDAYCICLPAHRLACLVCFCTFHNWIFLCERVQAHIFDRSVWFPAAVKEDFPLTNMSLVGVAQGLEAHLGPSCIRFPPLPLWACSPGCQPWHQPACYSGCTFVCRRVSRVWIRDRMFFCPVLLFFFFFLVWCVFQETCVFLIQCPMLFGFPGLDFFF